MKQKQGLVNGTGRLKHVKQQQLQQQPPVVFKKRTVIDQGPIPLYCSDECQLADLSATRSGPPLDPARDEPSSTAAPIKRGDDDVDPSLVKLAKMYNFPPLPPAPPIFDESDEVPIAIPEYNSGIMMAGRFISSLCPPPAKPYVGRHRPPPVPREPVPGWTDGSNAWRASVYSLSPPQSPAYPAELNKVYGSLTASPHRAPRASSSSAIHSPPTPPPSQRSSSEEMLAKFSQSFQRRSDSRFHASTGTPGAEAQSFPPPRRERAILPPAIQGKLLVPDVKLKVRSGSSTSLSTGWSGSTSGSSARSPLSVTSDGEEERFNDTVASPPKRPVVEIRSWSYENFRTYPVMQLPPKKVMQKQIINGEECEVEVEVVAERKCLFKFAPSQVLQ